ncbi:hypothetical protein Tco_0513983 [Tanacetum coccineum]
MTHVVYSHRSDEGSLKLNELTNLVTKLSDMIRVLEDDLRKTKKTYSYAFTKLILRVKKLEARVKIRKARKRAKVVLSEDDEDVEDDSSKQERKLSNAKKGSAKISTAGATKGTASEVPVVSTAEENISTTGRTVTYRRRSEEQRTRKDKGKAIMTESEPKKKSKKELARDEEIARQWDKGERQRAMSEAKSTKKIDWNDPSVIRYHALKMKPKTIAHARRNMIKYLKNQGNYKISDFKGMYYNEIRPIFEKKESLPRKRRTVKRQKLEEDAEKEELKGFLDIIPREEFAEDVESLSTKYPIVDWKTYTLTENFMYYQIFKGDGSSKNYKMISKMLKKKLEVAHESSQAFELLSTSGVSTASTNLVLPELVNTARRKINTTDGRSYSAYTLVDVTEPSTSPSRITSSPSPLPKSSFVHSPNNTTAAASQPSPTQPSPTQPSPGAEHHFPTPHDSPLHVVHSHGSDEGSLKLNELTNLVTKLSDRIGVLEDDLWKTKQTYSSALTKLILRVKKLEARVKIGKARKRAKVVLSEDDEDVEDDSSKQGRKLSDAEVQEKARKVKVLWSEVKSTKKKNLNDPSVIPDQISEGECSSQELQRFMSEMLETLIGQDVEELYRLVKEEWYSYTYTDREEIASKSRDDFQDVEKEIGEIVARRANDCIVSITEPDYKNLNKNNIKEIYLLIMNSKVPDYADTRLLWSLSVFIRSTVIWERVRDFQLRIKSYQQKINLTTPTMTFPGIKYHEMFSIIYEHVHGIIYKNSKKEKRVMRHSKIHKFCDATLNRVLEGLKSYNNDVKYGYIQKDLTKDETEYLKLFKKEIEDRLKHRRQMRRWEMFMNRRPLGSRRERLK